MRCRLRLRRRHRRVLTAVTWARCRHDPGGREPDALAHTSAVWRWPSSCPPGPAGASARRCRRAVSRDLFRRPPSRPKLLRRARIPRAPDVWAVVARRCRASETTTPASRFRAVVALRARSRAPHGAIGAHLGSALRLRCSGPGRRRSILPVDAIAHAPDGRVPRCRGRHEGGRARAAHRRSIRTAARGREAPARDLGGARRIWTALVGGRWSILGASTPTGKRMLLAHRNDRA